jgi:hypothetical protein
LGGMAGGRTGGKPGPDGNPLLNPRGIPVAPDEKCARAESFCLSSPLA